MLKALFQRFRWRRSPHRVAARAGWLVAEQGDAALFRAYELACQAQANTDLPQARFWEAVAREAGRQSRRRTLLAAIMQPLPRRPAGPEECPAAAGPPLYYDALPMHLRLVKSCIPATAQPHPHHVAEAGGHPPILEPSLHPRRG